jgi:hypothetical protein
MAFWKFVEFTSVVCRAIKCAACATALWTFEFGDSAKGIPFRASKRRPWPILSNLPHSQESEAIRALRCSLTDWAS